MKSIKQLKISWDILFSIYLIFTIISTLLILIALFSNDLPNINALISENPIQAINNNIRVIICGIVLGNILYVMVLFKLKKLISLFISNYFFTDNCIKLLKDIGSYLGTSTALIYIPSFLYNTFGNISRESTVFTQSVGKTAFLFLILLSLFFQILSGIFEEAKNIKDENDQII